MKLSTELRQILDCINNIDEKYYTEEVTKLENGKIVPTGQFRSNERTYANQLSGKIEQKFKELSIHTDKHYQCEVPKNLILSKEKYNPTFESLFTFGEPDDEEFYKIPDLIIHSGPNDINPKNQIFIAELKTSLKLSQKLFDIDLFKVNVFHEELLFRNSAFIIVNQSAAFIKERLNNYKLRKFYQTRRPGVAIIIKPSFNDDVTIIK